MNKLWRLHPVLHDINDLCLLSHVKENLAASLWAKVVSGEIST